MKKEKEGIVLDFLPHGYSDMEKRIPIAQVLGKEYFMLLEVVPKRGKFLEPSEEVYLGEKKREKVHHIRRRLDPEDLTGAAKSELPYVIEELVEEDEERFVKFFNEAGPATPRMHSLELLPGVGRKHMWEIIEERKKEEFKNFQDIKDKIKLMPDPKKAIVKRIIKELKEEDKYKLFID